MVDESPDFERSSMDKSENLQTCAECGGKTPPSEGYCRACGKKLPREAGREAIDSIDAEVAKDWRYLDWDSESDATIRISSDFSIPSYDDSSVVELVDQKVENAPDAELSRISIPEERSPGSRRARLVEGDDDALEIPDRFYGKDDDEDDHEDDDDEPFIQKRRKPRDSMPRRAKMVDRRITLHDASGEQVSIVLSGKLDPPSAEVLAKQDALESKWGFCHKCGYEFAGYTPSICPRCDYEMSHNFALVPSFVEHRCLMCGHDYGGKRLLACPECSFDFRGAGLTLTPWEQRENGGSIRAFFKTSWTVLFSPVTFFRSHMVSEKLYDPFLFALICNLLFSFIAPFFVAAPFLFVYFFLQAGFGTPFAQAADVDLYTLLTKLYDPQMISPSLFLVTMPVFSVAGIFIFPMMVHFGLKLVGGTSGGFHATFQASCYSSATFLVLCTPILLVCWGVGMVAMFFWHGAVLIVGLAHLHGIGYGKAAAGYTVAILLGVAMTIALVMLQVLSYIPAILYGM
ncbi:MAG: YIP1 family protein [Planctomycetes bacterium]|nr:YIP1 family protein [Planctomycetota bacterium]